MFVMIVTLRQVNPCMNAMGDRISFANKFPPLKIDTPFNRLLPKCNDRNKQPKRHFFTRKIDQFHPKTGQFRHFLKLKMLEISQIPLGSNRLKYYILPKYQK